MAWAWLCQIASLRTAPNLLWCLLQRVDLVIRGKTEEESDKVGLDLVTSSCYLHKLEEGSAGLSKSVASFLIIWAA